MCQKANMNYFVRNLCRTRSNKQELSLRGRKYIVPEDLSASEIKSLFLTAVELKTTDHNYFDVLAGKNMTCLIHKPCLKLQTILHDTSNFLKMPLNTLVCSKWEKAQNVPDIGKLLSSTTDIMFCRAHSQIKMANFAKGCTVPVININSCEFNLVQILSEILTLQEHFGTLNGINFAWLGAACPQLNTYLTVAPSLGINIRFLCQCGGPVSPSHLHHAQSLGSTYSKTIKECGKLEEVIKGANVIATSQHDENDLTIRHADLDKYAAQNWVFLHSLPRSSIEVEDEVFDSERNLLWKSFVNSKWICASFIMKFLGEDKKLTVKTIKDGDNYCY